MPRKGTRRERDTRVEVPLEACSQRVSCEPLRSEVPPQNILSFKLQAWAGAGCANCTRSPKSWSQTWHPPLGIGRLARSTAGCHAISKIRENSLPKRDTFEAYRGALDVGLNSYNICLIQSSSWFGKYGGMSSNIRKRSRCERKD